MKATIYNPYLDTLGGGERYCMAVAQTLLSKGYSVSLEWKDPAIKGKLEKRFGIDLGDLKIVPDIKRGSGSDVCFWVSDGSIPTLSARKNILHFQVPFHGGNGKTLLNRMKLFRISKVVCNSFFAKGFIDKEYGVESVVVYPPVATTQFVPKKKENIILFVGRFSQLKQVKNQDILINSFKIFSRAIKTQWKLVLAGGSEVGGKDFVEKLRNMVGEFKIEIIENPSFKEIVNLYGKAKIFWSAVGYGVNEDREPERVEHFGISVVEGMSSGAIPVVIRAGGYKEIVEDGENGILWTTPRQLVSKTKELLSGRETLKTLSEKAVLDSKKYSYGRFFGEFAKLL